MKQTLNTPIPNWATTTQIETVEREVELMKTQFTPDPSIAKLAKAWINEHPRREEIDKLWAEQAASHHQAILREYLNTVRAYQVRRTSITETKKTRSEEIFRNTISDERSNNKENIKDTPAPSLLEIRKRLARRNTHEKRRSLLVNTPLRAEISVSPTFIKVTNMTPFAIKQAKETYLCSASKIATPRPPSTKRKPFTTRALEKSSMKALEKWGQNIWL